MIWWHELIRLAAQFAAGLIVAWLTVRWALSRFKSEKRWERQASALIDVLNAIDEKMKIVSGWLNELSRPIETSTEHDEAQRSKYWEAHARIEAVAANSTIAAPE